MQVLIEQKRRELGYSKRKLARLAQMDKDRLRRRLEHPEDFVLAELEGCCRALRISSLCQVVIFDASDTDTPQEEKA